MQSHPSDNKMIKPLLEAELEESAEIEFTLTVGSFSEYRGMNGKKINEGLIHGILVKQMLSQLLPSYGWMRSNLTKLDSILPDQSDDEIISISSNVSFPVNDLSDSFMAQDIANSIISKEPEIKNNQVELDKRIIEAIQQIGIPIDFLSKEEYESVFGVGVCHVSKKELKRLAKTATIVTNSKMITPELFIKIQTDLNNHTSKLNGYLLTQEKRTLKQICKDNNIDIENVSQNSGWDWKSLGYNNQKQLDKILNTSMIWLSSNICHSQEVHFFVEQHITSDGKAFNKLRNVMLDNAVPNVLLSIPGIKLNLNFANLEIQTITNNEMLESNNIILDLHLRNSYENNFISAKELATNMWKSILDSAILHECKHIVMPAIGLDTFIDYNNHIFREIMTEIYSISLFELLKDVRYASYFDNVLLNPITQHNITQKIFNKALLKYQDQIRQYECNVELITYDIKMAAIEFAKKGARCAILNSSDIDVVLGITDVGHYYKTTGSYSTEEDIATTSTACIGSRGIQIMNIEGKLVEQLYTNRTRVLSTNEIEDKLGFLTEEDIENKEFIEPKENLMMVFSRCNSNCSTPISNNSKNSSINNLQVDAVQVDAVQVAAMQVDAVQAKDKLNEQTQHINMFHEEEEKDPYLSSEITKINIGLKNLPT